MYSCVCGLFVCLSVCLSELHLKSIKTETVDKESNIIFLKNTLGGIQHTCATKFSFVRGTCEFQSYFSLFDGPLLFRLWQNSNTYSIYQPLCSGRI